jgi:hypothetical protein
MSRCSGCYTRFQENQMAHIGPNGCLGDEEYCVSSIISEEPSLEMETIVQNLDSVFAQEQEQEQEQEQVQVDVHKSIANPLFELPEELGECPICYEELEMINFTVTTCGHKFHSSCVFKALENNGDCPCCRHTLTVQPSYDDEEEYEDDDDENDDEDDEDDENVDSNNEESKITIEELSEKLTKIGYSQIDILAYFLLDNDNDLKSLNEEKYNDEFMYKTTDIINKLVDGIYEEEVKEQVAETKTQNKYYVSEEIEE